MAYPTKNGASAPANPKLGAILAKLVRDLNYQTPRHDVTRPALEAAMLEYAAGSGAPYESEYARRYFDEGITLACAYFPTHPFAVKLHIAIYSWLIIYIDDDEAGTDDLAGFQTRFQNWEPQPSALLARWAETLHDMPKYFDPLAANFIVLSSLQFVNATLLERRGESGVPEAYAYFVFPRDQCPDIGAYMQAVPDMMKYINYANDVLSFHKETLAGETDKYINTRAVCEQREPLALLETLVAEIVAANSRVAGLLRTRFDPVYARKWNDFFIGYIYFHVTARRYKLHMYPELAPVERRHDVGVDEGVGNVNGREVGEKFGEQGARERPVVQVGSLQFA
ncbi:terpenoid synthase [Canariomyces notabilis]|uniref:Terpenoid synthase n=1 Tax=Canariomyces notabilis TaxID=2074819 RepID=A0AAN6QEN1_9PEZI|nr:terpenoid synthase [Canariomyces arenarius]